jgi:hypothetical protein
MGCNLRDGREVPFDNLVHKTEQAVRRKGVLQSAKLIQHAAQTPDVRLQAVGLVFADFGCLL